MFYKLSKKVFLFSINILEFLRVVLIFLAFFTVLYWFMQLWGFAFSGFIFDFFEGIKNFIHMFYQRVVTTDETSVDFSFLIAAFAMLFFSWGLKPAVEQIKFGEEKFDSMHRKIKQKEEDIYNTILETQTELNLARNNKILMLLNFSLINLARNPLYNKDANEGIDEKKKEVIAEFAKRINQRLHCKEALPDNTLLLSFEDFNNINNILDDLQEIFAGLKQEHSEQKWQINYIMSIEIYANDNEIPQKIKNLNMLAKLNFKNETVCLASFKQRYSLIKEPKYIVEGKGLFQISDNEETEVFSIKILR